MSKKLDLSESVMAQINENHIGMKPKWYFILGSLALLTGIIGSAIISIFLASLIAFSIKTHGPMGEIRYQQLLSSFPWWAPVAMLLGLIMGILLLKKYDFSYRKNFLLIAIIFIFAIIFSGWLINYLELDKSWAQQEPLRGLYRKYDGGWKGESGIRKNRDDNTYPGGRRNGNRYKYLNK